MSAKTTATKPAQNASISIVPTIITNLTPHTFVQNFSVAKELVPADSHFGSCFSSYL